MASLGVLTLLGCVVTRPPAERQLLPGTLFADRVLAAMDSGLYAYGEAWRIERAVAVEATRASQTPEEALIPLQRALSTAGRSHSRLYKTPLNSSSSTAPDGSGAAPGVKAMSSRVTLVQVPEYYGGDSRSGQDYARALSSGIESRIATGSCGWIVDLRGNTGGDLRPMLAGLSPLLPNGEVGEFRKRDGTSTSVTVSDGAVYYGNEEVFREPIAIKSSGRVAVLLDSYTASSAEFVAIAFLGLANVRSFGATTMGYATANIVLIIDDYSLVLTVANDVDRHGNTYPLGINPDVRTQGADGPLAAAQRWLTDQCD